MKATIIHPSSLAAFLLANTLMISTLGFAGVGNPGIKPSTSQSAPAELPVLHPITENPGPHVTTPPLTVKEIAEAGHALLYPNPAHDKIMLAGLSGAVEYRVTDVSGKMLASQTISNAEAKAVHSIDISHLQSGMYLLQLNGKSGLETLRFVVQ